MPNTSVSNFPINPFRHEFMILPHVETYRPIPAECTVCQVKHAQSRNRKEKSQPSERRMKFVSCESRDFRGYVGERNKSKSRKRYEQERSFQGAASAPHNPRTTRTPRVLVAYPADHQRDENDF